MHSKLTAALALLTLSSAPVLAGDTEAGEKAFRTCKACHEITDDNGTSIVKGGKTGPNLYGVVGRQAGALEGFRFGESIKQAGEEGLVWNKDLLADYMGDPRAFLRKVIDDGKARSKMTFKARKGADDIAAYLAAVGPEIDVESEVALDIDLDVEAVTETGKGDDVLDVTSIGEGVDIDLGEGVGDTVYRNESVD